MQHELHHRVTIRPRRVLQVLALLAVGLALLNLGVQVLRYLFGGLVPNNVLNLFDVNREANVPTFYSVLLLLLASGLLLAVAVASRRLARPFVGHWYVLSAVFLALAMDEFIQLHELVSALLAQSLGITDVRSHFLWVIPAALAGVAVGFAFLRFLLHLPRVFRLRVLLAGACLVGGAMGLEAVAAAHASFYGITNLPHSLIFTVEELLEMLGVIVLVWALLHYLRDLAGAY
ncbi:MAG TPA: hypothetical protein PKD53_16485, partial [Chloroflexaceae bacterium]|nr:hypothetical protein [Chloroflexaceae bacterium]